MNVSHHDISCLNALLSWTYIICFPCAGEWDRAHVAGKSYLRLQRELPRRGFQRVAVTAYMEEYSGYEGSEQWMCKRVTLSSGRPSVYACVSILIPTTVRHWVGPRLFSQATETPSRTHEDVDASLKFCVRVIYDKTIIEVHNYVDASLE